MQIRDLAGSENGSEMANMVYWNVREQARAHTHTHKHKHHRQAARRREAGLNATLQQVYGQLRDVALAA